MHSVYEAVWEQPLKATVIEVRERAAAAGVLEEVLLVVRLPVYLAITMPVRSSLGSELERDPDA